MTLLLLVPWAPVLAACAVAIKAEGLLDRDAGGPVFFREQRVSQGRVIGLLKLRTLTASALAGLGPGPPTSPRWRSRVRSPEPGG